MFRVLLSFLLLVLSSLSASSQYMMEAKQPDFYSFSKQSEYRLTDEAAKMIAPEYRNHLLEDAARGGDLSDLATLHKDADQQLARLGDALSSGRTGVAAMV